MLEWCSPAAERASVRNRFKYPASTRNRGCMTLSATRLRSDCRSASYTTPIPPLPTRSKDAVIPSRSGILPAGVRSTLQPFSPAQCDVSGDRIRPAQAQETGRESGQPARGSVPRIPSTTAARPGGTGEETTRPPRRAGHRQRAGIGGHDETLRKPIGAPSSAARPLDQSVAAVTASARLPQPCTASTPMRTSIRHILRTDITSRQRNLPIDEK